jgi:hypothetical protein
MTNVSIAALFAAISNNLSGNVPQLFDLFEGGVETAFTGSDRRSEPASPERALLTGSVDGTFNSVNIF